MSYREAVIVSTARTPIGKAYRGAFNDTQPQTLGGHAIRHAVDRAGLEAAEIDDVVMGCGLQQGATQSNIARQSALRAGLPTSVSGMSIDRQCASGLMAIATGAKQILVDGMDIVVAGGVESVSLGPEHPHEHVSRAGPLVGGAPARRLYEHAGNRRNGRAPLRHQPRSTGYVCGGIASAGR